MRVEVLGHGNPNADLAIVGESPGRVEVQTGEPFRGPSGRKLNDWLRQGGILRRDCWLDNIMHVRPPGDSFKHFYEDGDPKGEPKPELTEGIRRLKETLGKVQPNVILALGAEPLKALTGRRGIGNWRGSILPTELGKVIGTYHPSYILRRNWDVSPLCIFDVKRASKESLTYEYTVPFEWENLHIPESVVEIEQYVNLAMEAEYLAIDIEAPRGTRWASHFGFAWSHDEACCIRLFIGPGTTMWTEEEELYIWDMISRLCMSDSKKILQNMVYDVPQLNLRHIVLNNLWMDTMIAQSAAYPELDKGLDLLTSLYTNIPYYYDLRSSGGKEYCQYNCLDCLSTWRTAHVLQKHLTKLGTSNLYHRILHPVIGIAFWMQEKGIRCNVEWREEEIVRLEEIQSGLVSELRALVGRQINVNSTKQCQELLYEEKGIRPILHPRTHKPTTDEEALYRLLRDYDLPEIPLILRIRHVTKLLGTYYRSRLDEDNRIRCSWNVAGAVTGRWSSRKTAWSTGMDLENIPYYERKMCVPDEGKIFLYADLAQAEMRIVAWRSGDEPMKQAFRDGKDIHKLNTMDMLQIGPDEVTKERRYACKQVGHAANYRAKARTISIDLGKRLRTRAIKLSIRDPDILKQEGLVLNTAEAQAALDRYFAAHPRIGQWQDEVENQVKKTNVVTTKLGRKRIFYGRKDAKLYRQAIDQEPQATVADLMNIGIAGIFYALPEGAEILLQNQDAVLVQCYPHQKEEVCRVIRNALEFTVVDDLTIPVEIQEGNNWYELSDVEGAG